jgi:hypothetical protein
VIVSGTGSLQINSALCASTILSRSLVVTRAPFCPLCPLCLVPSPSARHGTKRSVSELRTGNKREALQTRAAGSTVSDNEFCSRE